MQNDQVTTIYHLYHDLRENRTSSTKKYLPEDIIESALEKAVEIGGDTVDALSLVYEMHKPTEED